jgi:hypothetical protein
MEGTIMGFMHVDEGTYFRVLVDKGETVWVAVYYDNLVLKELAEHKSFVCSKYRIFASQNKNEVLEKIMMLGLDVSEWNENNPDDQILFNN